ncbi:MAG: hypothetical protein HYV02_04300 [Deltaproteobacteria bacterium]|nr:hypothetical protein [Deltaproteobacteria bacterium]
MHSSRIAYSVIPLIVVIFGHTVPASACSNTSPGVICLADFNGNQQPFAPVTLQLVSGKWTVTAGNPFGNPPTKNVGVPNVAEGDGALRVSLAPEFFPDKVRFGLKIPIASSTWQAARGVYLRTKTDFPFVSNVVLTEKGMPEGNFPYLSVFPYCANGAVSASNGSFFVAWKKPLSSYAGKYEDSYIDLRPYKYMKAYRCDGFDGDTAKNAPSDPQFAGLYLMFIGANPHQVYLDDLQLIAADAVASHHWIVAWDFGGPTTIEAAPQIVEVAGAKKTYAEGYADFIKMPVPLYYDPAQPGGLPTDGATGIRYGWDPGSTGLQAAWNQYYAPNIPYLLDPVQSDLIWYQPASPKSVDVDRETVFHLELPASDGGQSLTLAALLMDSGDLLQSYRNAYMEQEKTLLIRSGATVLATTTVPPATSAQPSPVNWHHRLERGEPTPTTDIERFYFDGRRQLGLLPFTVPLANGQPVHLTIHFQRGIDFPLAALMLFDGAAGAASIQQWLNNYLAWHGAESNVAVQPPVSPPAGVVGKVPLVAFPVAVGDRIGPTTVPNTEQVQVSKALLAGEKAVEVFAVPGMVAEQVLNLFSAKTLHELQVHMVMQKPAPTAELAGARYDIVGPSSLHGEGTYTLQAQTLHPFGEMSYFRTLFGNRQVWFQWNIPENAPSGSYAGTIEIAVGEMKVPMEIPVRLHVLPLGLHAGYSGRFYNGNNYRRALLELYNFNFWNCFWSGSPWWGGTSKSGAQPSDGYPSSVYCQPPSGAKSLAQALSEEKEDKHRHRFHEATLGFQDSLYIKKGNIDAQIAANNSGLMWSYADLQKAHLLPPVGEELIIDLSGLFLAETVFVARKGGTGGALCTNATGEIIAVVSEQEQKAITVPGGCIWFSEPMANIMLGLNDKPLREKFLKPWIVKAVAVAETQFGGTYPLAYDILGERDNMPDKNKALEWGCETIRYVDEASAALGIDAPLAIRINGIIGLAIACEYCTMKADGSYLPLPAPVSSCNDDACGADLQTNYAAVAQACLARKGKRPIHGFFNHTYLKALPGGAGIPTDAMEMMFDGGNRVSLYNHGYGRYGALLPLGYGLREAQRSLQPWSSGELAALVTLNHEHYATSTGECVNNLDGEARNNGMVEMCDHRLIPMLYWEETYQGIVDARLFLTLMDLTASTLDAPPLAQVVRQDAPAWMDEMPLHAAKLLPAAELGALGGWDGAHLDLIRRILMNHAVRIAVATSTDNAPWTSLGDLDGDGIALGTDNCPLFANTAQDDVDQNGLGDACQYGTPIPVPVPPVPPGETPDCAAIPNAFLVEGECVVIPPQSADDSTASSPGLPGTLVEPTTLDQESGPDFDMPLPPPLSTPTGASAIQGGGCSLHQ